MDDDIKNLESKQANPRIAKKERLLSVSILISALIIAGAWIYTTGPNTNAPEQEIAAANSRNPASALEEKVLPSEGVVLPVRWGELGIKLASVGVIDRQKFDSLYSSRGGMNETDRRLLEEAGNGNIKITSENSAFLLNLFWALGLGTKNEILENGPIENPRYGGAGNFASTAGWTLSQGNAMEHYSRHPFVVLTPEQQQMVERVSKNIYRPCCNNSTYFPDCNHGMAMLGLLELMASQGVSEQDMWKTASVVNSYWFPDTYLTIATYMKNRGTDWKDVNPQEILGVNFSSASGFSEVASEVVQPTQQRGGNGCGVDAGETIAPKRSPSGCGI